jgi:peptidoglycan-associated lipoprotein
MKIMNRKIFMCCAALVVICSAVLMLSSCAKRQVQATDTRPGAVAAPDARVLTEEEAAAKRAREADEVSYRARKEAERQASIAEMSGTQGVQAEIHRLQMEKIYFDFDNSDLSAEAREVLRQKADWLVKNPGYMLTITGHCDERGTREYNIALGQRRADAAFKYLNALGVSSDRMITVSKGKEEPFDPRSTPEAWAKNRRVEFKLVG